MKLLKIGLLLLVLLLGSFALNIGIHEYGHYVVADHYGLNPEIHIDTVSSGDKFALFTPSIFTSYTSGSVELTSQDAVIAFAGPFVNLAFALVICAAYLVIPKRKRTFLVQTCFAMLAVPAFLSFVVNLLPVGFSDGAIILSALLG